MEWHIFNPVIIPIAEIIIYVQTNTKYVNKPHCHIRISIIVLRISLWEVAKSGENNKKRLTRYIIM